MAASAAALHQVVARQAAVTRWAGALLWAAEPAAARRIAKSNAQFSV